MLNHCVCFSVFMREHTHMHISTLASFLIVAGLSSSNSTWGSSSALQGEYACRWPTCTLAYGGKIPSNHICHLLHLTNPHGSALNLSTEEIKLPALHIEVVRARLCINSFLKCCHWVLEEASVYPRIITWHLAFWLRDHVSVTKIAILRSLLTPWGGLREGWSLHDLTCVSPVLLW